MKLDPYFDKDSRTLRVGGRFQYSHLQEATKHPVKIPHGPRTPSYREDHPEIKTPGITPCWT
jgi:hypothetical protein